MKKIVFLIVAVALAVSVQAQKDDDAPGKFQLRKMIKQANKALNNGNIYAASDLYEEILEYKPEHVGVAYQLAESYRLARDYKNAEKWYGKTAELNPVDYPLADYWHAMMMKVNGKYVEAKEKLTDFRKSYQGENRSQHRKWARIDAEGCDLAIRMIDKPEPVEITHLDTTVNSPYTDIAPILWNDSTLLFASLPTDSVIVIEGQGSGPDHYIKFYAADKKDERKFSKAEIFDKFNIAGEKHVANGVFSLDRDRFYFTQCEEDKDRNIICAIYESKLEGGEWQEPVKLPETINDPKYTSTHPAIGEYRNGEVLYYVSNRPGGRGGMDIWYATIDNNGGYRTTRNCGSRLNTSRDEATPFYDKATQDLYFSSNGHVGMGGYDVFRSSGELSKWSGKPENLGYPVNSGADDMYFRPILQPGEGYMVSNRPGIVSIRSETCCDDIFHFKYYTVITVAVEGIVYDEDDSTRQPIEGSGVTLSLRGYEGLDSDIAVNNDTIVNGDPYFFKLKIGEDYKVTGSAEGYLTNSVDFDTEGIKESDTLRVDIPVKKIEEGKAYRLKYVYYDFDKWFLREESKRSLDTLYKIMQLNPNVKFELSSHTDSRGTESYNQNLSQKRAESCVDYLIQKGIPPQQIVPKGYGESKLLEDCTQYEECPEDNSSDCPCHQKNRRTEFKPIGELDAELIIDEDYYEDGDENKPGKKK